MKRPAKDVRGWLAELEQNGVFSRGVCWNRVRELEAGGQPE